METYGYRPCYLRLGGATPRAILPLMEVDSWLTGRRGVGLPFTDRCEPLLTAEADFAPLREAASQLGRTRGWKYVQCCGGRDRFGEATASTTFFEHVLELAGGESHLLGRFDGAVRRAIKRGETASVQTEFSRDAAAMESYYHLHCLTRKRQGMPPQPVEFFRNIQRHVLSSQQGWIVLARHDRQPVAGAVYFQFGRQALYKFGASDERWQQLRANQLVMWEAIKRFAAEGFASLDFGRTSLTNEGLRRYKLNWGTIERRLDYVRFEPTTGRFLAAPDRAAGWHNRLFQLAPTAALRLFGALLYRHQG